MEYSVDITTADVDGDRPVLVSDPQNQTADIGKSSGEVLDQRLINGCDILNDFLLRLIGETNLNL